jgi:hypothetical protein
MDWKPPKREKEDSHRHHGGVERQKHPQEQNYTGGEKTAFSFAYLISVIEMVCVGT